MATYLARYAGQMRTRISKRVYTHASVVIWKDGEITIHSFHSSEEAARKGTLTAQQRRNVRNTHVIPVDVIHS